MADRAACLALLREGSSIEESRPMIAITTSNSTRESTLVLRAHDDVSGWRISFMLSDLGFLRIPAPGSPRASAGFYRTRPRLTITNLWIVGECGASAVVSGTVAAAILAAVKGRHLAARPALEVPKSWESGRQLRRAGCYGSTAARMAAATHKLWMGGVTGPRYPPRYLATASVRIGHGAS